MARRAGEIIGEQVRHFRRKRGWRQQDLVDRLDELGIPGWRQSKIVKIERGEAKRVPVDDVLELAFAFGVPPVMLLAPSADDDPRTFDPATAGVEVAPGRALPARVARDWIRGKQPLISRDATEEEQTDAALFYFEAQPPRDWMISEDDFRLSALAQRVYQAREQLLEEQMAQFDAEYGEEAE